MASPRMSVCPHFVSGADLGNPWRDFFYIANTHSLGGVDVLFGCMTFDLLKWSTVGHN